MTAPSDHTMCAYTLHLPDETHTQTLAQALAAWLPHWQGGDPGRATPPSLCVHLRGELGAGKTSLTRALLRACGVTGRIKSPSYALLESYKVSSLYFYHLDFYRFSKETEWQDAGFSDLFQEQAVLLIEWPEQAGGLLPAPALDIHLTYAGQGRQVTLAAHSPQGTIWLKHLTAFLPLNSRDGSG